MNSINAKASNNLNTGINQKPVESVETAGSLAFNTQKSWLAAPIYDSFTSSNPFTPDYSTYSGSESGSVTSASTGFLASFSSAVSTISSGSFSSGTSAGFSGGGCSAGSCSSGGGFSSFC